MYAIMGKVHSSWEAAALTRGVQLGTLWYPEAWNGAGGREAPGGEINGYLELIHTVVQQKPTQWCKAIILQLGTKSSSHHRLEGPLPASTRPDLGKLCHICASVSSSINLRKQCPLHQAVIQVTCQDNGTEQWNWGDLGGRMSRRWELGRCGEQRKGEN